MRPWRRKNVKEKRSEWFFNNGSTFLQELIADSNGISNPIRFFSSDQILKATDPNCYLSRHRLFTWYKGVIEDRPYAIKKFTESEFTGERVREEVYNDMVLSARVSNQSSFLKLVGCSLEFSLPVMVFEYPENGVLSERGGFGCEDGTLLLPWNVRLKIAKEVAIAVTYLHTAFPRIIIHRDIKPTNVFLDKNWTAKLTDFTFSVTLPEGKSWIEEDLVKGTLGYIDPVSISRGLVTEYTDVFSFGILMLVLLMGRPAIFVGSSGVHCNILHYVKDLHERGETAEFGGDSNDMRPGQMKMFLDLALRCCEERNEDRPKMILVAKEIKRIQGSLDC